MRPEVFRISIRNRNVLSYFPGELVRGIVHVEVGPNQLCSTKGIILTFDGRASVCWSEEESSGGTGDNQTTASTSYSATEKYFHSVFKLLDNGSEEKLLPPGKYQFPFRFNLPRHLPSSFKGAYGKVEYFMQAEMLRGSFKMNYKAKVPFTVNGIVDLNIDPSAAEPTSSSKYKNLCCLCCRSGPVGFTLSLPRSGFVSGEFLHFTANFFNNSRRRVSSVTAYILQKSVYHANARQRTSFKVICKQSGPSIEPGDSETWSGNILQIPPLPPTLLAGRCRIIDVQYLLKIEMHLAGVAVNLRHEVPIIIGSIPLRSTFQEIARYQSNIMAPRNMPSAPPPYSYFQENFNYPDMPPPSYAEAIGQIDELDATTEANLVQGIQNPQFDPNTLDLDVPDSGVTDPCATPPEEEPREFVPKYITYGHGSNC